jgi:glycosyltransferase 2 family protein
MTQNLPPSTGGAEERTPPPAPTSASRSKYYLIAALGISALFLWLALRRVNWADFLVTIQGAQIGYLAIGVLISATSIFGRAIRWGVLIGSEKKTSPITMYWATSAGYMGNNVLPARSGDVIRSYLLGRKEGLSFWWVLATTLTERVIDALVLILLGLILIPLVGNLPGWLWSAMRGVGVFGVAALLILFVSPLLEKPIHQIIGHLPIPAVWQGRIDGLAGQFILGAKAFLHPLRAGGFLLLTAVVWSLDGIGATIVAHGLHVALTFPQALVLLIALGLSSSIPSTPGYVGVYQLVAVTIMPLFGINQGQALAFILTSQVLTLLLTLCLGLVGLWRLTGSLKFPVIGKSAVSEKEQPEN